MRRLIALKFVCVGTKDIPNIAIVDTNMMPTMPKGLTAATDMGALTHTIEGYTTAELLWGCKAGSKFTSELPAYLMSHTARLKVDTQNRVVMHSHPAHMLTINFVHELDEAKIAHNLREMCTEYIVVFPRRRRGSALDLCGINSSVRHRQRRWRVPTGHLKDALR